VAQDNEHIIAYLSLHSTTSFQNDEEANFEIFVLPDNQRQGKV